MTRGERVVAFIEAFCIVPEGMLVGKPIRLEAFQKRFILDVYDNPKKTSLAILSIARKNGKTGLIAGIVLAHIAGPEARLNSQIVSGARSRKQAAQVFNYARKMVMLSPALRKLVKVVPSGKTLIGINKNVEYEALSAEASTAHGLSPVVAILDEVGQVRGSQDAFIDAITTAQGAHNDPLLIAISTQAADDADLLSQWIDDAKASNDPHIVCHVYEAPKEADLMDKKAWKMANPALGSFRSVEDMERQAEKASRMPSAENSFRNLCLNQRVSIFSSFIARDVWKNCGGKVIDFGNSPVYAGLDLSARTDLTALVIIGKVNNVWQVAPYFWSPEVGLIDRAKRDRQPYDVWAKQGYLQTTSGATVDYEIVAQDITAIMSGLNVQGIAYDRWRIEILKKEFFNMNVELPLMPWGQGFKDMSPALDAVEAELLNSRVAHENHPVLTMCAANAIVVKDGAGNRKLDKHTATGRIDGIVAMAMAFGLAYNSENTDDSQSFEDYINNPLGA